MRWLQGQSQESNRGRRVRWSALVLPLALACVVHAHEDIAPPPNVKEASPTGPDVEAVDKAPAPTLSFELTAVPSAPPAAQNPPPDMPTKPLEISPPPIALPTELPATLPITPQANGTPLDQPSQTPLLPGVPRALAPAPVNTPIIAAAFRTFVDPPLGFTGRSSVLPREKQTDPNAIAMEDRWRIGFPEWDRYDKGHPPVDDYPYVKGHWWDPFNQNVLKGDYPLIGQNTFLVVTARSQTIAEYREVPIPTTPFESTSRPFSQPFFGRPNQFAMNQFFTMSFDLFHGDAAFRPMDWRVKITPVFNINYLANQELGIVNPNVLSGLDRTRSFATLQEYFVETKLADIGPNYDFVSVRAGSQPFVSDFRGFLFSDVNTGVRLFGNYHANRDQFNLAYFEQRDKDTNSGLNSFSQRSQQIVTANHYKQDFIFPGYTAQWSVLYNRDDPTFKFDRNHFLVRPDPVGIFQPHGIDVVYFGWAGDGHINRFNITHQYYWATGHDSRNPMANQAQEINAHFAAAELSYDRDWARFRTSFLFASGDSTP
jgi:hypothetical protein